MQDKQSRDLLKKQQQKEAELRGNTLHPDEGVADLGSTSQSEDDVRILDVPSEESIAEGEEEGEHLQEDFQDVTRTSQDDNEAVVPQAKKRRKASDTGQTYVNANEVHASLVRLFDLERDILSELYGTGHDERPVVPSADMFFIQQLLVPPNKYRKESKTGPDKISEATDNTAYGHVLDTCQELLDTLRELQEGPTQTEGIRRLRNFDDLQKAWLRLQDYVTGLIDSDKLPSPARIAAVNPPGIKQKLEKKEGMMRMNVMGKRVNFAARSVISPDPNIETNEVGVPPVFAKKLTYPEPVTPFSFEELKQAVLNGADVWPGAVAVESEQGQVINLRRKNVVDRQAIANSLLAPSNASMTGSRSKKVHRHLTNGDIVIMNRQPTLHKPSMMAHRAKVLPGEKTIRMHYANCNSYNADFDGDEMNMHFPQNEIARAESLQIADTDHQYLSATAGEPLRGLIQDHISVGVWLTCQDTFFTREEYQELLYSSLRPEDNHINSTRIKTVHPTILKPSPRWTGKQIISTILLNLQPESYAPIHMASKTQTDAAWWGENSQEGTVRIDKGEMLTGVLDKKQIGPKPGGLVHVVYEAYGHTVAGKFLSILGRLLTRFLSMHAFSCGVEDLMLTSSGDQNRSEKLEGARDIGLAVASRYVLMEDQSPAPDDQELNSRLESVTRDDEQLSGLDTTVGSQTKNLTSAITKTCLPEGLLKPFPRNQMQTMTATGAKGSQVNANLISCNLGQQVLEGRRVPVMVSGKTLPSFKPFEPSIRAGGYIIDRFLTGIRPQEYFFHAMAGREGLIDTAVKTARSGYLQRCLVKGLEGLRVAYDTSVRDADGTVIQSLYGEDGLDITRQAMLTNFNFVASNFHSLLASLNVANNASYALTQEAQDAREHNKKAEKLTRKTGYLDAMDTALSTYSPSRFAGSSSESYLRNARKYIEDNPDGLIRDKKKGISGDISKRGMETVVDFNYLKAIVQAGEAVGVVAAQSLGEPSTQMTLNTFHLAGHSAKNVTLGIPRLREILMTASKVLKTPTMALHFIEEIPLADREKFARGISRRSLAEVVDEISVKERLVSDTRTYEVKLALYPALEYTEAYTITVEDVARTLETKFIPILDRLMKAELRKRGLAKSLKKVSGDDPEVGVSVRRVREEVAEPEAEREGGDSDVDDDGDDDATTAKKRSQLDEGVTYDDPDDSEAEIERKADREADADASGSDEDETYGSSSPHSTRAGSPTSDATASAARKATAKERELRIVDKNKHVMSFAFNDDDPERADTCAFTLSHLAQTTKVLLLPLIKRAAHAALIQEIPGIDTAALIKPDKSDAETSPYVLTAGVNLLAMRDVDHQAIINPHRTYTNSVEDMRLSYGIEAARDTIIRELQAVFESHFIAVNIRHLTLVADYMTRSGEYVAFSRGGMANKGSPFAKMSFEGTMNFLKDAVLEGARDELKGPSARMVVGRVGEHGTGGFDVLVPVAN